MKNYYQILQVDVKAEQEVIEAAYKRLMRKYHPDVLPPEKRNDKEILEKVQEINEAYETLGNVQYRHEYDNLLLREINNPEVQKTKVEKRAYFVKCAKTKRTFKVLMGRREGWAGPFRVLGLEPIEELSQEVKKNSVVSRIRNFFCKKNSVSSFISGAQQKEGFLSEAEILNLFDETNTLSMSDIEWAGYKCPDCAGEVINPNGTHGNWVRCGTCSRLRCAGGMKKQIDGYYSTCPWCGKTNKLTRSIATGEKEQVLVAGRDEMREQKNPKNILDNEAAKKLFGGEK
jgi:hypothetical protein